MKRRRSTRLLSRRWDPKTLCLAMALTMEYKSEEKSVSSQNGDWIWAKLGKAGVYNDSICILGYSHSRRIKTRVHNGTVLPLASLSRPGGVSLLKSRACITICCRRLSLIWVAMVALTDMIQALIRLAPHFDSVSTCERKLRLGFYLTGRFFIRLVTQAYHMPPIVVIKMPSATLHSGTAWWPAPPRLKLASMRMNTCLRFPATPILKAPQRRFASKDAIFNADADSILSIAHVPIHCPPPASPLIRVVRGTC